MPADGESADVAEAFHDAHRGLYGYDFRDDPTQQVEWVNLRVTGIGPITRPELRQHPAATATRRSSHRARARSASTTARTGRSAVHQRDDLAPGDVVAGPAMIEEYGSTVPVHPGFAARVDPYLNLVVTRA